MTDHTHPPQPGAGLHTHTFGDYSLSHAHDDATDGHGHDDLAATVDEAIAAQTRVRVDLGIAAAAELAGPRAACVLGLLLPCATIGPVADWLTACGQVHAAALIVDLHAVNDQMTADRGTRDALLVEHRAHAAALPADRVMALEMHLCDVALGGTP